MSIVVDTCELHSAFDGQCFGCVVASFHAQCRCISDLRDRVQKLETIVVAARNVLVAWGDHWDCSRSPGHFAFSEIVQALDDACQALSPNGTEGGGTISPSQTNS